MLNCFTCKLCSTCVFSSVAKIKLLSSLPSQSWLSSLSHHHPLSCLSLHPRRYTYLFLFPLSNIRVAFISKSSHFQLLVRPVSPVVSVSPAILALTIFHLGSCYVLYGCLASVLAFWSTDLIMSVLCSNLQCFPLLLGFKINVALRVLYDLAPACLISLIFWRWSFYSHISLFSALKWAMRFLPFLVSYLATQAFPFLWTHSLFALFYPRILWILYWFLCIVYYSTCHSLF